MILRSLPHWQRGLDDDSPDRLRVRAFVHSSDATFSDVQRRSATFARPRDRETCIRSKNRRPPPHHVTYRRNVLKICSCQKSDLASCWPISVPLFIIRLRSIVIKLRLFLRNQSVVFLSARSGSSPAWRFYHDMYDIVHLDIAIRAQRIIVRMCVCVMCDGDGWAVVQIVQFDELIHDSNPRCQLRASWKISSLELDWLVVNRGLKYSFIHTYANSSSSWRYNLRLDNETLWFVCFLSIRARRIFALPSYIVHGNKKKKNAGRLYSRLSPVWQ